MGIKEKWNEHFHSKEMKNYFNNQSWYDPVYDNVSGQLTSLEKRNIAFIKKFGEKQQIILITHQKRTMKIADTIYGVTMQSNGVSKIISEKIGKNYAKIN